MIGYSGVGSFFAELIPLPREAGFRQSFAYAGEAVDRRYSVLVFPEGRHTVDGKVNPFRAGIGLLANNLNIPVLPMRIVGMFEVKQAGKNSRDRGRLESALAADAVCGGSDPAQIARSCRGRGRVVM